MEWFMARDGITPFKIQRVLLEDADIKLLET